MGAFGKSGFLGDKLFNGFSYLFGFGYYLIPLMLALLGFAFIKDFEKKISLYKLGAGLLCFLSALTLLDEWFAGKGGTIGGLISKPMLALLGSFSSTVILLAFVLISVLVIFDTHLQSDALLFWQKLIRRKEKKGVDLNTNNIDEPNIKLPEEIKTEKIDPREHAEQQKVKKQKSDEDELFTAAIIIKNRAYTPPPLSLLETDSGKPGVGDIKANANIIKRTLQNFGIDVEMDEITIGPTVTRYSLKPAEGVKLSKIVGLQDNLALALAAQTIRIEAPIPGKSLVGIEVPNTSKTAVGLGSMLGSKDFQNQTNLYLFQSAKMSAGKPCSMTWQKCPTF